MQVWQRRADESSRQYQYFKNFLELGTLRTLQKVQEKYNKSIAYFQKLSSKHEWTMRADAYDRYIDEIVRKENIEAIKKANKENVQLAQMIKYAAGKKVQVIIDKIKDAGGDLEALEKITDGISWNVLPTLFNIATEIERKAYGINDDMLKLSITDSGNNDVEVSIAIKKKQILEKLQAEEESNSPAETQEAIGDVGMQGE
ncbi:hypothetical protein [Treponema phagedenis]|uniref:hypothetical protein n=1 Tax=Treponema phagedenis TaxID=162 RepID=UPI00197ED2A0|nr:hypothetical protein [Treponema phagedenis]QSH93628.1 hypothetical protein C5O78_00890 [Treponema phagedenis]